MAMRVLSLDEARAALAEALAEFEKPENKARMEAAIASGTRNVTVLRSACFKTRVPLFSQLAVTLAS